MRVDGEPRWFFFPWDHSPRGPGRGGAGVGCWKEEEKRPGREARKWISGDGESGGSQLEMNWRDRRRTAISKRKKCASVEGHVLNCTVGNRQKNGQHSETVALDNPQLGCLTPKGQMSANSPRVFKHLWFLLDMSELVSLIIGTFPLSHLLSVLDVPMR